MNGHLAMVVEKCGLLGGFLIEKLVDLEICKWGWELEIDSGLAVVCRDNRIRVGCYRLKYQHRIIGYL